MKSGRAILPLGAARAWEVRAIVRRKVLDRDMKVCGRVGRSDTEGLAGIFQGPIMPYW